MKSIEIGQETEIGMVLTDISFAQPSRERPEPDCVTFTFDLFTGITVTCPVCSEKVFFDNFDQVPECKCKFKFRLRFNDAVRLNV